MAWAIAWDIRRDNIYNFLHQVSNFWTSFQTEIVAAVQSLSYVQLFATPCAAACQASWFFAISWSLLTLMSIESVVPSHHLILCHSLLSCLKSFPASGSFPMSRLFTSRGQSIGTSQISRDTGQSEQAWYGYVNINYSVCAFTKGIYGTHTKYQHDSLIIKWVKELN